MLTGFSNAAVSKGILICTTLSSVCFSVAQSKYQLHLDIIPHLYQYHQYWRLLVHQLGFTDSSQLFLSTLILYRVSITIERLFGSRKFAAFLFLQITFQTLTLSILLPFLVLSPLSYPLSYLLPSNLIQTGKISSGPFGLIFACLDQYARLVPDSWTIKIGQNFWLGERWTVWILAGLLFFSHPIESILPSLLGLLFSSLYSFKALKHFRLPSRIEFLFSSLFSPIIGTTKLPPRTNLAEFPRNPTFEERSERIEGERIALERERERGGRYGLNLIRRANRRGGNQQPVTPQVVVRVEDEHGRMVDGNTEEGNSRVADLLNVVRSREGGRFGRPLGSNQTSQANQGMGPFESRNRIGSEIEVGNVEIGNADIVGQPQPTSNPPTRLRHYLNQISGEVNENFNQNNIDELQAVFQDTSRDRIVRALQLSDGDRERAIDRLLGNEEIT